MSARIVRPRAALGISITRQHDRAYARMMRTRAHTRNKPQVQRTLVRTHVQTLTTQTLGRPYEYARTPPPVSRTDVHMRTHTGRSMDRLWPCGRVGRVVGVWAGAMRACVSISSLHPSHVRTDT